MQVLRHGYPDFEDRNYVRVNCITTGMEKLISKAGAIASFLGLRTILLEQDHTVVEFDAGPQHANPMGTLHGGLFCDLSDYAMGTAWVSGLNEGESCTTIELKINFLSPFRTGKLIAEARVVRRGRNLGFVECDVRDANGKLLARASSTCMTLRGDHASGR